MKKALLGVNIDHVATLRQLRGTPYPDLLEAARLVEQSGGDQITVHLREDRRHIQDEDVVRLKGALRVQLNLEMAATPEMTRIASKIKPDWVCLVPEKRREVTTEGGLAVEKNKKRIAKVIEALQKANIQVSLFIEPSLSAVRLSHELGADAVELHTGKYCLLCQEWTRPGRVKKSSSSSNSKSKWIGVAAAVAQKFGPKAAQEFLKIESSARLAHQLGLKAHAGHGFDYENVRPVAELENPDRSPLIEEYNIGHAIVCRAALVGMERAVREMVSAIGAP